MKVECTTTELDAQSIIGVRTTIEFENLAGFMGRLFPELFEYLQKHGQSPAGMPLTRYHGKEASAVELECALPIASPVAGTDRIRCGELPAGTMATVTHMGHYDNLPTTWAALTAWMHSEGLQPVGVPWEVYVTDPGAEPNQSKWRTDIFFPVRSRTETS